MIGIIFFILIFMWFEHYRYEPEDDKAEKLFQKGETFGVNPNELEDGPANPTNKEKEKSPEERMKEQQEKQEKQDEALKKLRTTEGTERANETATASQSLDQDVWPPVDFDDDDSVLHSQIGNTEGGTTLDNKKS